MEKRRCAKHDERFGPLVARILAEKPITGDLVHIFDQYCQIFGNSNHEARLALIANGKKLLQ